MQMCRSDERNDWQRSDPDGMGAEEQETKVVLYLLTLRDRSGIMQLIFENGIIDEEGFAKAGKLRSEFVIAVVGTVAKTRWCSKCKSGNR